MVKVILLLWWCCINRLWRKFIFAGTLFVPLRVSAKGRCAGLLTRMRRDGGQTYSIALCRKALMPEQCNRPHF